MSRRIGAFPIPAKTATIVVKADPSLEDQSARKTTTTSAAEYTMTGPFDAKLHVKVALRSKLSIRGLGPALLISEK
jgi:hypothetical protein